MTRRAAFLDRDGVLVVTLVRDNRAFAPVSLDEFQMEPDAGPQVGRLAQAGLLPIVVTNQPEVARGIIARGRARRDARPAARGGAGGRHLRLPARRVRGVPLPQAGARDARRRRPRRWDIDLAASYVVGDRWRDVEAGRRGRLLHHPDRAAVQRAAWAERAGGDLTDAVDAVLATRGVSRPWIS